LPFAFCLHTGLSTQGSGLKKEASLAARLDERLR
jgi:hypothetical protein